MDWKLAFRAVIYYAAGVLLVMGLLFLPAGTLEYPGGWRMMGLLFVPMLCLMVVLWLKAPELLRKRLSSREKQTAQQKVVKASGLLMALGFLAAPLDFRFGWSQVPGWLTAAGSVGLLVGYGLYAEVMRENAYLSRTVEVQEGQKVVDTGLYGVVRHPMYAATILLFLSVPLVLGSFVSLAFFLGYPAILTARIRNEEQVLEEGLAGYREYKRKVKWRLLPFVW